MGNGELGRLGDSNDSRHIEGSCSQAILLRPARYLASDLDVFSDIERPYAWRAVKLMRRNRDKVDIWRGFYSQLPEALRGVSVEKDVVFSTNPRNLVDWLNGANLVIDVHN